VSNNVPLIVWSSVASSADGTKLVAGAWNGPIFLSTNSGVIWFHPASAPTNCLVVASSADGNKLAADGIYVSLDSGVTWTSNSIPVGGFNSIASSADGNKLVGVASGAGIYISQTTPSPSLSIALADNTVSLSWLIPSLNFTLQQSPDLIAWSDVANTPALNLTNLQNQVTLPMSVSNGFYRLTTSP
jgi:hypothetical protein